LNQGSVWKLSHHSGRIIYGFYAVSWIILAATYTAYLVSFLSVKKETIPFSTASELGENTEYKLGTLGGAFSYNFVFQNNFSRSNPGFYLRKKIERDWRSDSSVIHPDINHHINRLLTEKYAFFGASVLYETLAAESCNVAVMKEKGGRSQDGFAFRKNSAYGKEIDHVMRRILEGNLAVNIKKRFLPVPKQCSSTFDNVSLENVCGVFYTLCVGLFLALAALSVEVVIWIGRTKKYNTPANYF